MLKALKEAIEERVLVCDGAMGTMLYAKGVFINKSFDALNVTQPDLVAEVHAEYVRAGADIIETNTFGANRIKLGSFGLADRLHAINEQGARIARHAADDRAYVAGAIGPLGIRIEPWGKTGVNCAVGPAPMLDTIERMAAVTKLKLTAQPNAGKPRDVEGRNIYLCSPEYMASYARRFILHNVRLVGGCCGTTPEHIRQIKMAVRALAPAVVRASVETPRAGAAPSPPLSRVEGPPVPRDQKSRL